MFNQTVAQSKKTVRMKWLFIKLEIEIFLSENPNRPLLLLLIWSSEYDKSQRQEASCLERTSMDSMNGKVFITHPFKMRHGGVQA